MNSHRNPILLSDAPIDPKGDLIWHDTDTGLDIEMIADTIINSEYPLVFAVHGPWGSGKTSFLKIIEERLKSHKEQKVHISWYIASNYQAIGDVSTTLTLRILRTIRAEDTSTDTESIFRHLLEPTFGQEKDFTGEFGYLQKMAQQVGLLADLGIIIQNFLEGGTGSGKSKLVVMIDDLDRCSLDFISDLVETTQRLSSVRNLFIFLAVDQIRLQNALEKRFEDVTIERGPRWAGEKYIQHTIELPVLNRRTLDRFIRHSLMGDPKNEQAPIDDPAVRAILNSTDFFVEGVPNKMPRTIKACINLIRPVLAREIRKNPNLGEDDKRKIIKRRLIDYLFSDFSKNWLKKAESDLSSPESKFFKELEELSREYYYDRTTFSEDKAMYHFRVKRLKVSNLLEQKEIEVSEELAKLLARPPYFVYEKKINIGIERKLKERYYDKSEEARLSNNMEASVQIVEDAYEFIRENKDYFSPSVTWMIHNLGLNAQEFDENRLAEALYRVNLKIDPRYVKTMVNLASVIIKSRPNHPDEAKALLIDVVINYPDCEDYIRALVLLIQLKITLRESVDEDLTLLCRQIEETNVDGTQLREVWQVMLSAGKDIEAIELFNKIASRYTITQELFDIANAFALELSLTRSDQCHQYAMDLYRLLLNTGEQTPEDFKQRVKAGYANLLSKKDYTAEAGKIFFEVYNHNQKYPFTTLYAEYLDKIGRYELAEKVGRGEPLDLNEPVYVGEFQQMPQRFSTFELPPTLVGESE